MSGGASSYDKLYKLLIVGADNSGTSELLMAFSEEVGDNAAMPTDFTIKFLERNGVRYKLQVWDAGKEQDFKTASARDSNSPQSKATHSVQASTSYYRGAHGVLLLYNATSRLGFEDLQLFIEEIGKYGRDNVKVMVVSYHFQKSAEAVIPARRGQELADRHGLHFMEVDCTKGEKVTPLFEKLIDLLSLPPQFSPESVDASSVVGQTSGSAHGNKRCIIL